MPTAPADGDEARARIERAERADRDGEGVAVASWLGGLIAGSVSMYAREQLLAGARVVEIRQELGIGPSLVVRTASGLALGVDVSFLPGYVFEEDRP